MAGKNIDDAEKIVKLTVRLTIAVVQAESGSEGAAAAHVCTS
jgi:hypothetical protein